MSDAFAVVEAAEDVGPPRRRRHGHAVAQPLSEDHHVRFQAVGLIGEQVAGAAEVGLHLVEDENQVIFAAEGLQHLQISGRRVEGAAAAEVRLGDQYGQPPAELVQQRVQFAAVRRQVERPAAHLHVHALGRREADEADARVAVAVGFGAGDGAGQALLAVKAVARGHDHVARPVAGQRRPQRLLDRLGTRCGPHHLFQPPAAGPPLQHLDQQARRLDLDRRDGVIGRQEGRRPSPPGRRRPAHVPDEAPHPTGRIVSQVGDQDAGSEVVEPPAFRRPVEGAGTAGQHGLGRRVGARARGSNRAAPARKRLEASSWGCWMGEVMNPPRRHTAGSYSTVGAASPGAQSTRPPPGPLTTAWQPGRPSACRRRIASIACTVATTERSADRSL